jgi:GT2 family glycosyltransferase
VCEGAGRDDPTPRPPPSSTRERGLRSRATLARRDARRIVLRLMNGPGQPMSDAEALSVVVPAYREAGRLPASLARLPRELDAAGHPPFEVVVVDDGSDDATADAVRAAARADPRVRLLRHETNRGKGHAVRTGVLETRGGWVLVTDADLSTPPQDVRRLLAAARRARADVAIGSRRMRGARILVRQGVLREVLGHGFALLRRLLVLPRFRDTQCGFKLFRAEAARALFSASREDGFVYDVEVLVLAARRRLRVVEVPVRWAHDPRSRLAPASASVEMFRGLLRLARARAFGRAAGPRPAYDPGVDGRSVVRRP